MRDWGGSEEVRRPAEERQVDVDEATTIQARVSRVSRGHRSRRSPDGDGGQLLPVEKRRTVRTGRRDQDPVLRCTGRAYPHRPIRARPGRPAGAHLALPGPGLSRFLLLRGRRAERSHAGQGFTSTSIWIFPEVGGAIPADPTLPIPSNAHWMPLASLVQVPFLAVLGPTAWASALPFALIGALAAPLTWAMARDAGADARSPSAPASSWRSRSCRSSTWSSRTTSRSSSRWSSGRCGWARAGSRGRRGRSRWPACWPAWRRCRATTACWSWGARPRLPVGPLAGRRGPSHGRRPRACVGLFVLVMAPWWLRQLAVFGSLSPSTASGKVLFIRDIGEWNSIATRDARSPAGDGHRAVRGAASAASSPR